MAQALSLTSLTQQSPSLNGPESPAAATVKGVRLTQNK